MVALRVTKKASRRLEPAHEDESSLAYLRGLVITIIVFLVTIGLREKLISSVPVNPPADNTMVAD